ncbi:uncharacterized protein LOC129748220 [Uranotaenia lowii]|uniref:uncharacterized protein LOC129745000 n=1 Tax=Uranotaenia lowii TaxID=190385 RepID=UPI00247A428D|nr:uncharacterized protein LOC129745000 [Uranotaenia lowii]XP_055598711.1 uncharacterized protein LOC129748220 [Uranotaenia lowii]
MLTKDKLVQIPASEWHELRDLFVVEWPSHEIAYYTIQNYIDWFAIDPEIKNLQILSLNGDWRDNGTYLIVDRYQMFVYTLEANNDSLKRALFLIDWDYSYKMCSIRQCHRPALEEVFRALQIELAWQRVSKVYRLAGEEAAKFEFAIPQGMYMDRMKVEHAPMANELWSHRCQGSEFYMKRIAAWNPSVGLFDENGEPVAWCFVWPTGAIGPLEVTKKHHRKGYGTIIAKAIAQELAKIGRNCYATILSSNMASQTMFDKIGFHEVDEVYFTRNRARKLVEWDC